MSSRMPISKDSRHETGRHGEDLAAAYLAEHGFTLVARNWRTRRGELDIVARAGDCLVLVEVRSRILAGRQGEAGSDPPPFGLPEDSVTRGKQRQLAAMAAAYVYETGWAGPYRVDVIGVELDRAGTLLSLRHYPDAIGGY
jgi:putative endonuclease